jgi:MoaA/NifB/PqqE/SkfB family radical SAM enzyme
VKAFDQSIRGFCRDLARVSAGEPRLAFHFARTALRQREAAARRRRSAAAGVQVPPLVILSVTRRCNLRCAGCFVQEHARPAGNELTMAEIRTVLSDARDLGVSMVALAGGEPLTRPEIIDMAAEFPELLFPLITNGSLLDDAIVARLETLRNVIPVISLEGLEFETDGRRGDGVYQKALDAMARLQERHILFGASLMVTRRNFGLVTSRRFVSGLVSRGARLFFYVDYVPIKSGTERLIPSQTQRGLEPLTMRVLRSEFKAMFLASSASEAAFGGCMAAGRGFVHVSAEGDLEPCPFSPYADTNLREVPLRVALQSRLLRNIRESDEHLSESAGGCALWAKRDWVQSMMEAPAGEAAGVGATGAVRAGIPAGTAAVGSPAEAPGEPAADALCCDPGPTVTRRAA